MSGRVTAKVEVDGTGTYFFDNLPAGGSYTVGRTGRNVRVQLVGTNYLSLAEVQVWGTP